MKATVTIFLLSLMFLDCSPSNPRPYSQVTVEQMKTLFDEIPKPARFQQTDEQDNIKSDIAVYSVFYKTDQSYSDVREFYDAALPKDGWVYGSDEEFETLSSTDRRRRFSYLRQGCTLWIEYNGISQDNRWNFGISLVC
jgi:hypothetical protein